MAFLSENDRQRVADAVAAAERRTSGEFVTVIAREADDYFFIPSLWAGLIALLVPGVLDLLPVLHGTPLNDYLLQLGVFVALALLFRIPALKHRLVPRTVAHRRAHLLATEQFLVQNLHHTEGRTGVLLFVAVAERHVEILADQGIHNAVPAGSWERIVDDFVARVRARHVADGFVEAIGACGDLLEANFPRQADDRNELPDRLVEL